MSQAHELQQDEGGYSCSRCSLTWKQSPSGTCPGAKVYQYKSIPWDMLATATQLKRQKLKAAEQAAGCYFRLKDKEYIYLYRIADATPRRVPTEKQREAIGKMQEALKKKYTCEKCGYHDSSHGQSGYRSIGPLKEGDQERRYCEECRDHLIWCYDRHVIEYNMRVTLEQKDILIVDTETTGLLDNQGFQVVEVSVIDKFGTVVYHSLTKPDIPMPAAATAIHGLTDADLADAPSFAEIWPQLSELLTKYELWTYNADFDFDAIISSATRFNLDIPERLASRKHWHCVMRKFSRYYGQYSSYWEHDQWKDLGTACYELNVEGNGYHRAVGDALNALGVMRALAKLGGTSPDPAPEERPTSGSFSYDGW